MKILLIRVSSLGDVLHNLPLVDDLHRHYPDAQIDWVVEEAYVSLLQLHPGIRRIIPYAQRRWRKHLGQAAVRQEIRGFIQTLRSESYDLILETQGLLKTGIILGLAKKAPGGRKIGLANGTAGSGYEGISRIFHDQSIATDPYTHAVDRGRLVAAKAIGKELNTPASFGLLPPSLEAPWRPAGDYIVFFHGTAGAAKKWARTNWIALAAKLASTDMPVLLPWGNEEEKKEAEAMAAAIPQANALPKLSMMDAVLLAQSARLAIGVDTGLTHIAAAYETPTVEIYTASPRWKTEGNWSPRIRNTGDAGKIPSVDEVYAAAMELLN